MNSRRHFLQTSGVGFGWLAFQALAQAEAGNPLAVKQPHFSARAKRVIFLCMRGAPSHVDTFDYKPKLAEASGKDGRAPGTKLHGSQWKFSPQGKCGLPISELFPHLSKHADELCLINSMHTELPAHAQSFLKLHTGNSQFVRPSLGAWALYGLGTLNENLPGFVTIAPPSLFGGAQNYGSAFLPEIYQGTRVGSDARPIANAQVRNITPPVSSVAQRKEIELIQTLNREKMKRDQFNPEIEGAIESFELAFKMQSEMPKVMDLSKENRQTLEAYGIGDGRATDDFGRKCLLARRMVEAGVRFVEVTHSDWDHHFKISQDLPKTAAAVDQSIAALLADLQSRGLLKDTLVVWSGEFGRTPHGQGVDGRDHNSKGFTAWMAGGGVKGGLRYGSTDDLGYEAVEDKMHTHDFHATILHLLGLDHERLTYRYAGRDFRLSDVKGSVAKKILA
ncbi:DUF1501 domain-containing protein [Prosthecobacter fluviatilis]|uniref:DUF1501 domain-containing protein n=1 Tax=Prosthecobacter fluviatilis TaxID=445931 RepID=A0ABW0KVX9_9BACT